MKKKNRQRKQRLEVSPEQIQRIEEGLGVKFVDFQRGIFKFKDIVWKPVKNEAEYLCASWDNVPMIRLSAGRSTCHFVPLGWRP